MLKSGLIDELEQELEGLRESGTYKVEHELEGPQGPRVTVGGRTVVMLTSNNYLGLADHPRVVEAARKKGVAVKEGAARDIALAFGVPPVLVGLPGDATYANAREAGRALYRQTILPMAEGMLRELAAMLGDWLGPVAIAVDTDQISELAEDRARLWESVGAAEFLSRAEKRAQLGFESEAGE